MSKLFIYNLNLTASITTPFVHGMDVHLLLFVVLFWFVIQGNASHQLLLPEEIYWKSMLPNTPMPKVIHNLIQPGNASTIFSEAQENTDPFPLDPRRARYGVAYIGQEGGENVQKSTVANSTTVYFLIDDLIPGKNMMLTFTKSTNGSNFLPQQFAQTIPFSTDNFSDILNYFSINPTSKQARIMKETIEECEAPGVKGEEKYCSISLKSLVDFVVSKYGNKVEVFANEAEEENKKQKYIILEEIKMIGDSQIVCHKQRYPYAVFYCHIIMATEAYLVPLVGEDGSKAEAVVVCHMNTSSWNPNHLAFQLLKVKPGGPPICHFLNSDTIVWIPS
ncbi:BURP domain-containing protein 5-like [Mercurialis annua]|uniref:BURP domain-containing protein 5-like n=1 Tax=Mercurialis annua TaxID=3986 RepID=UPI00215EAAA3|nr:BURP domain-containing protein 5-like [Mercurialis annua]